MSARSTFASWLGTLFGHSELQVRRLLEDESALHFLVAWGLFEAKCFRNFVSAAEIEPFAKTTSANLDASALHDLTAHFHARYQNEKLFKNLMHQQKNARLSALLKRPYNELGAEDKLFFLIFVIYRYRNNMFHCNT